MGRREKLGHRLINLDRVMEGVDLDEIADVLLQPISGRSRAEVAADLGMDELSNPTTAKVAVEGSEAARQFRIRDMLLLTTCGAIGTSGGYWIPAGVLAGLVGLSMLLLVVVLTLASPELKLLRTIW